LLFTYTSVGQAVLIYLFWPIRTFAPNSDVERLIDFRLWKSKKDKDDKLSALFKDPLSIEGLEGSLLSAEKSFNVPETKEYIPLSKESAKVQLLSKEFLLGTIFYSVNVLAMSFWLGTIFVRVDGKAKWLPTNVLLQANVTPIVLAWPCSFLLDRFGFSFGIGTVSICSIIMFCTLLPDSIPAYVVSSIFLGTFRCFMFATFFGYIGKMFGFTNYGVIVGASTIFSGVFCELGIVLNWVAYNYDFCYVDVGLAAATGILFLLALTLGVWEWDEEVDNTSVKDPNLPQILRERQDSVGVKITYMWSRIATVTPRRLRMVKKRELLN